MTASTDLTCLLESWQQGDTEAFHELNSAVYAELKRHAARSMGRESDGHTLQATALVHEAFLKLIKADVNVKNRTHFFSLAGRIMRNILIDHARTRKREKRGYGMAKVTLHESVMAVDDHDQADILELDSALEALEKLDARKSRIMELELFAGLTKQEIAELLEVSLRTVERDSQLAKAWLRRELERRG